jgi:hypothetical protein
LALAVWAAGMSDLGEMGSGGVPGMPGRNVLI